MFGRRKIILVIVLLFVLTTRGAAQEETAEETLEKIEIDGFREEELVISPQPTELSTKRGVRGQAIIIPSIIVVFFIFCCY